MEIARMRWRILERGLAGDLDGTMDPEERSARAEAVLVGWVNQMREHRMIELLPMALTVMQDLARDQGAAGQAGDTGSRGGLAALEHFGPSRVAGVPSESREHIDAAVEHYESTGCDDCAPDNVSGDAAAWPQPGEFTGAPRLGQGVLIDQFGGAVEPDDRSRAWAGRAGRRIGGEDTPLPPPGGRLPPLCG